MKTLEREYSDEEINLLIKLVDLDFVPAEYELERFIVATVMASGKYCMMAVAKAIVAERLRQEKEDENSEQT